MRILYPFDSERLDYIVPVVMTGKAVDLPCKSNEFHPLASCILMAKVTVLDQETQCFSNETCDEVSIWESKIQLLNPRWSVLK